MYTEMRINMINNYNIIDNSENTDDCNVMDNSENTDNCDVIDNSADINNCGVINNSVNADNCSVMDNTTIIITGASRGIGRAIAIALASPSTNLVISCSKSEAELQETYDAVVKKGAHCTAYVGDMGNYSNVLEMFDLALSHYGKTDILINNAGIAS